MDIFENLYNEFGNIEIPRRKDMDEVLAKALIADFNIDDFKNSLNEKQASKFKVIMSSMEEIYEREKYICFKNGVKFAVEFFAEANSPLERGVSTDC